MAHPKIAIGGITSMAEIDRKTKKLTVRRFRQIYTDAIAPNLTTPDQRAFQDAIEEAIRQTANDPIDGYIVNPWEAKP